MQPRYLGDGVYAEFDGYHIVLKANSHTEPTDTVYIDSHVWASLQEFAKQAYAEQQVWRENEDVPSSENDLVE